MPDKHLTPEPTRWRFTCTECKATLEIGVPGDAEMPAYEAAKAAIRAGWGKLDVPYPHRQESLVYCERCMNEFTQRIYWISRKAELLKN